MHEKQTTDGPTSFITLTYAEENLPYGHSLSKRDLTLFWKRLRKALGTKIRYYAAGEYGTDFKRPHYHAILYNENFEWDRKHVSTSKNGNKNYVSNTLDKIWGLGQTEIADATQQNIRYTAGYILKKITGDAAEEHYQRYDYRIDKIIDTIPEFSTMSRHPGLGQEWYNRYGSELWQSDSVVIEGKELGVPDYYLKLLEKENPDHASEIKKARRSATLKNPEENDWKRLHTKEVVKRRNLKNRKRNLG